VVKKKEEERSYKKSGGGGGGSGYKVSILYKVHFPHVYHRNNNNTIISYEP
jgi:hypothetical protein